MNSIWTRDTRQFPELQVTADISEYLFENAWVAAKRNGQWTPNPNADISLDDIRTYARIK
jgi:hypothetical protein